MPMSPQEAASLAALRGDHDHLEERVTAAGTAISFQQQQIQDTRQGLAALRGDVATVDARVDVHEDRLNGAAVAVTGLDRRVTSLEGNPVAGAICAVIGLIVFGAIGFILVNNADEKTWSNWKGVLLMAVVALGGAALGYWIGGHFGSANQQVVQQPHRANQPVANTPPAPAAATAVMPAVPPTPPAPQPVVQAPPPPPSAAPQPVMAGGPQLPPRGWYPNPAGTGAQRYWNGTAWEN